MITAQDTRREKVLEAIRQFKQAFPYLSPTVRELGQLSGISSTSQVHKALDDLEKSRVILPRYPGKSRSIVLRETIQ